MKGSGSRGSRSHRAATCQGRSRPSITGVKEWSDMTAGTGPRAACMRKRPSIA